MNSARVLAILTIPAVFASVLAVAQDAPPAEMMATPYFERQHKTATDDFQVVPRAEFGRHYAQAKKPTLMVLVGKSFGSTVSEWRSNTRVQLNTRVKSNSNDLPQAISSDMSVQYRSTDSGQRSNDLSAEEWQDLERGIREVLLSYNIKLLQQNLATRLLDAELRASNNQLPVDDSLRLETDVLRKHAKLLIEVLPVEESRQEKQPLGFQLSISSLASSTIVAERRIGLNLPAADYKAGANGYELQLAPTRTDYRPGTKGYDVIHTYPNFAYENGKQVANALVEMLNGTALGNM